MKLLLLCLGLTLICAHDEGSHEVVTSDFDMSKISGEWYTILLASNVKERIEENSAMRGFVESIQSLDNSSLTFKFHIKVNGECTEISLLGDPLGGNGVYNVIYAGFNILLISEAVYSDYLIFQVINFNPEKPFDMMGLYARKPDVSPKLKERFGELCQKYGIPEENILDLTDDDRCLQARGSHVAQDSRWVMCDGEGVPGITAFQHH
ncbi:allergen Fel d 4-like [Molossus molossus]|uniref:allergen Fel d 4-like n=1 Tax=Molossus molossus TaxID=27622 RepID=UPI001745C8D5|nr:allergen Fel d 4-like [Molossus molossus]